jgi:hypothetical protein
MLLRNLDVEAGLCNGVRAIVIHAMENVLDVKVISGKAAGRRVFIPRLPLAPQNPDLPFILQRRQFPVKLAFAMTINKAQGQTLTRLGVYLPEPVFSHGQLYVALSRSGTMEGVRVLTVQRPDQGHFQIDQDDDDSGGIYTLNIVWPEALLPINRAETANPGRASTITPAEVSTKSVSGIFFDENSGPDDLFNHAAPQVPAEGDSSVIDPSTTMFFHEAEHGRDEALLRSNIPQLNVSATHQNSVPLSTSSLPRSTASSSHSACPAAPAYSGYFERQVLARCGLHALNNAMGIAFLDPEDMDRALEVYLNENYIEGNIEDPQIHISQTGWFSEAVMATALRVKHNLFKLNLDDPIQDNIDSMHRIFSDLVLGVVVNIDNRHWIAYRCVDEQIWKLDSAKTPARKSFAEFQKELKKYRNKFAIEQIQAD